ncbi:replicative DNA helicase [Paenibacillus sp. UNCCL117]|uniref:DnaB-like helicase C-terminal domain-containing protein n=1 Tax=unclassified Paenibacillus TaxID=185978 RepID=UPI000882405B|nr:MULTISPECIES: DnaB-like helicase C-terminal domain-containing protein [unclassified Paenibacillus]SDC39466.1 replicative DNA helicase [Paenibacillus sp. cl123]SFW14097.1 replicative DNA helicase [Paenibacillus sp. UNCCL117]
MTGVNRSAAKPSFDLEELVAHYQRQLSGEALYYLQRRGIEQETAEQYRIGFEPGKIGFYVQSGKIGGYFENRVIIPIVDQQGLPIDLIGRSIDSREPKYKTLVGEDGYLFNESVLEQTEDVVLCGGLFDVLNLAQSRLPAVCPPAWMTFKETYAEKFKGKRVFVCLGNDELGRRESSRIQELLQGVSKDTFIVNLPESIKDVNDFFVRVQNPLDTFIQLLNETMEESLLLPISPDVKHITAYTEEYMKRYRGQSTGLPTGFELLDKALFGGLRTGLYFITGCASSGKTMLMKQIADEIASRQTPVVYVSWDMTSFELWARSIARLIGTEPQLVLSGQASPDDVSRANKQYVPISKWMWTIECSLETTMDRVFATIERIAGIAGRTPVVFIDHLNRIPTTGLQRQPQTVAEHQTMLAYVLKQWSRENDTPVISAIPIDLGAERLPEGAEASADVILSLTQEEEPAEGGTGQLPCALRLIKHRNGSLATVPLRFLQRQACFEESAPERTAEETAKSEGA